MVRNARAVYSQAIFRESFPMRAVLYTIVSLAVVAAVGGAAFVYSGAYNVAATEPHWPITHWVLETVRVRSIKAHAAGLSPPAGFDDAARIPAAVGHFSEHCALCHGAPGTKRDDVAQGMYPQPPDLTEVSKRYTPAELFWILKNGIKMSAMPSMADDGDDMLWATVAFLRKLPGMSVDEYNDLWMASQAQGGMNHDMKNMGGMSHSKADAHGQVSQDPPHGGDTALPGAPPGSAPERDPSGSHGRP